MARRENKPKGPQRPPLLDPSQQDQALRDLMPIVEWLTAADIALHEGAPQLADANLHAALAALQQVGPNSPAVKAYIRWLQLNTETFDPAAQEPFPEDQEPFPEDTLAMAKRMKDGFGKATRAAAAKAHAKGLAVPGRRGNMALEVIPGGRERPIENTRPWSPRGWRNGKTP